MQNQVYIGPDGSPFFKMYHGLYLLRRGYVTYGDLMKYGSLEIGRHLADIGDRYIYHDAVTNSLLLPIINGQFGQYSMDQQFSKGKSKYVKMYNLNLQKVVDIRILKYGHLRNGKNAVYSGMPYSVGSYPETIFDTFVDHPLINQPMSLQQLLYELSQSLQDVGGIVLKHTAPYRVDHYSHSENITYYLVLVLHESSGEDINFIANFCQNNLINYPDSPGRSDLPNFRKFLLNMSGDQPILPNLLSYARDNLVKDNIIISVNQNTISVKHLNGTIYEDMKVPVSTFIFDFNGTWQIEPHKIN